MKYYQTQEAMSRMQPPPPAMIAATKVKQEQWHSSLTTVGSLVPVSGITVSNEIAGIIKTIHFDSGQNVKKDQPLIDLDSATDQAELSGLLAQQRLSKIRFDRSQKLIKKNLVSQSEYDQNRALLDESKASVLTKKTVIDKKMIRAPFSGDLGIRKVNLGEYLTPGSAIVSLQQLAPIYIDFQLPARHFSNLDLEQEIRVNVQAYPEREFKGKVSAISPQIDLGTRSVKIRATIPNTNNLLHPGMFGEVQVLSERKRQVKTLPDTALSYNPYGNFVFVIESSKQGLIVQSRQVVTGETREGRVEIIKGLNLDEQVVSAGQIKLRNGMSVTLDEKPAPGEQTKGTTP